MCFQDEAPGNARITGQVVQVMRVPVGVQADAADHAVDILRTGLGNGKAAARAVLANHHGHGSGLHGVVALGLHRCLSLQDQLGRLVGHHLDRDVGIPVVDHLDVFEEIKIEILNVTAGIPCRLLTHALGRRDPVLHGHPRHTLPSSAATYGAPMMTTSAPSRSAAVLATGCDMKLGVSGAIRGKSLPAAKLVFMKVSQSG